MAYAASRSHSQQHGPLAGSEQRQHYEHQQQQQHEGRRSPAEERDALYAARAQLRQPPITVDDYFSVMGSCYYRRTGDVAQLMLTEDERPSFAQRTERLAEAHRRDVTRSLLQSSATPEEAAERAEEALAFGIDAVRLRERLAHHEQLVRDPVLSELVEHTRQLPLGVSAAHEVKPRTRARDATQRLAASDSAPTRVNHAAAKWGAVKFGDDLKYVERNELFENVMNLRQSFADKPATITFPEQVSDEARTYAASRFGPEWELFDATRHADFEARQRMEEEANEAQRRDIAARELAEMGGDSGSLWWTSNDEARLADEQGHVVQRGVDGPKAHADAARWDWVHASDQPATLSKFRTKLPERQRNLANMLTEDGYDGTLATVETTGANISMNNATSRDAEQDDLDRLTRAATGHSGPHQAHHTTNAATESAIQYAPPPESVARKFRNGALVHHDVLPRPTDTPARMRAAAQDAASSPMGNFATDGSPPTGDSAASPQQELPPAGPRRIQAQELAPRRGGAVAQEARRREASPRRRPGAAPSSPQQRSPQRTGRGGAGEQPKHLARRTHTEAVLPFFRSGVEQFDARVPPSHTTHVVRWKDVFRQEEDGIDDSPAAAPLPH